MTKSRATELMVIVCVGASVATTESELTVIESAVEVAIIVNSIVGVKLVKVTVVSLLKVIISA